MTEAIIYMLFNSWCEEERPENVEKAMRNAVENPSAETIEELVNITEKDSFTAGAGACLNLMQTVFTGKEPKR